MNKDSFFFPAISLPFFKQKIKKYVLLIPIFLIVQGCAVNNQLGNIDALSSNNGEQPKILLMPMDVELSLLTASGLTEPKAEWTQNAKKHMLNSMNKIMATNQANLTIYPDKQLTADSVENQLNKLHQAVGASILVHKYAGQTLPTKTENGKWSLGDQVLQLRDAYDADYGLFLYVRDSYASAGRVVFQILAAAAGVGVNGGTQAGYASLVDLKTGEIVWFNFLARGYGDLRKEEPAHASVEFLLQNFPGAPKKVEG